MDSKPSSSSRPRRRRTISGLEMISMTVPVDPSTTPDAMLQGIPMPEVIKPPTPDLRLAQMAPDVFEAEKSIHTADDLLASLQQVEITLRLEVERAEEALSKHADPDADPEPPSAAANEETPETDPDRLTLLVGQTLKALKRLRGAGEDEAEVERLRQAQRAGARLLAWLASAVRQARRQCNALAARRATRLRAEAMSLEASRTRERYVREGAATRAAIAAQDEHRRAPQEAKMAARALAEQHMHQHGAYTSLPEQRTFVECEWREKRLAEKRQRAAERRASSFIGLHRAAMKGATRTSAKDLRSISALLNRKMRALQERDGSISWFKLFNHIDDDASGHISYIELEGMVREVGGLALSLEELPERKLKSIWLVLDADNSGLISAGEFGAFVRLGVEADAKPKASQGEGDEGDPKLKFVDVAWRKRVLSDKRQKAAKVRQEFGRLMSHDIKALMVDAPRATAEELQALSVSLNRKMHAMQRRDNSVSFFKLFKHIDEDGSGQISYSEFSKMVRAQLGLSREDLSERNLMSSWLAIDEDSSGLITAGELNSFLRSGEDTQAGGVEDVETPRVAKLYFPKARGAELKREAKRKATRARTGEPPAPPGSLSTPYNCSTPSALCALRALRTCAAYPRPSALSAPLLHTLLCALHEPRTCSAHTALHTHCAYNVHTLHTRSIHTAHPTTLSGGMTSILSLPALGAAQRESRALLRDYQEQEHGQTLLGSARAQLLAPQGSPGGSGRLDTPRGASPGHWVPSRCLRCLSSASSKGAGLTAFDRPGVQGADAPQVGAQPAGVSWRSSARPSTRPRELSSTGTPTTKAQLSSTPTDSLSGCANAC